MSEHNLGFDDDGGNDVFARIAAEMEKELRNFAPSLEMLKDDEQAPSNRLFKSFSSFEHESTNLTNAEPNFQYAVPNAKHVQYWKKSGPVVKDFYCEPPNVANMSQSDIERYRENVSIEDLSGEDRKIPNPVRTFEDAFAKYPEILESVKKNCFSEPTPIQRNMWPIVMSGYDCIGIAQTGSGKTIAFLFPAFLHIYKQREPLADRIGPSVLILSPVRELALQIEQEICKYAYKSIKCTCVVGGTDIGGQAELLSSGITILVGTPGRLNDMLNRKQLHLASVTMLIIDEADRMLDDGFEPQIRTIIESTRPDRQTIMTSATWPNDPKSKVRKLAAIYLFKAMLVHSGLDLTPCKDVDQHFEYLTRLSDKEEAALKFVEDCEAEDGKLIIFMATKAATEEFSGKLSRLGYSVSCLNSNFMQCERQARLRKFRESEVKILVATDVASRGLDVPDITHVLNFDFPSHIEEYVHRVGRTGRAGKKGKSLTLFNEKKDYSHAPGLIEIMQRSNIPIPNYLKRLAKQVLERRDDLTMKDGKYADLHLDGLHKGHKFTSSYEYRSKRVDPTVTDDPTLGDAQLVSANRDLFMWKRKKNYSNVRGGIASRGKFGGKNASYD